MRNGTLTIGELIELLQEQPDHAPVYMHVGEDADWAGTSPITEVVRGLMEVELR